MMKFWIGISAALGVIFANTAFCSDKINCTVAKITTHVESEPINHNGMCNPYKPQHESVIYTLRCPEEFKIWTASEMSIRLLMAAKASGQKISVNYDQNERDGSGIFHAYGIEF